MHKQGYLLLAIAVPNIVLGTFILLRNARNLTNIFFAGLALSGGLWSLGLAGYIFVTPAQQAILWAQEYYTAAAFIAFFFLAFSVAYTGYWRRISPAYKIISLIPLVSILLLINGLPQDLLTGIKYHSWGKEVILNPAGYKLFSAFFILYAVVGFWFIYRALTNSRGLFKTYLKFLFAGLIAAFTLGALFNLFYPAFGNYQYIWIGPLFTVVYISLVSYAIIKHKMFDIRSYVVRTIAYVLTLAVSTLLYVVPALLLTNYLLDIKLSHTAIIMLALITMLSAILFQNLRSYINRATARFFYRDYYEPQGVLDEISSLLVGSVDLQEIEKQTARIIRRSLKPAWLKYIITATKTDDADKSLTRLLDKQHNQVVLFDELDIARHSQLHMALRDRDIAVTVRLHTHQEQLGYLLMGFKQSGSPYSADDQRLLSTLADEIAIGLQNALRFEEIQQFNVTLQEKIDEATKKLRHANVRLKELDATKDEFISMASHQLRTPLTTIKGYLSMILDGDVGKVKKDEQELIQHAFDSAQRMVYLIADLLNVSRLQTGKFVIENQPTYLPKVVEGEITQLGEQATTRKIMLAYDKPKEFPTLNLDETKIRQVIMNFLDNALYYTPPEGTVTAKLEATADSVSFTVTDTGVGVPANLQHHLFTKFYRADNARKMRPDGTGLGLYMAKKVIVAQGGALIFKSTEGKGSTFGFSFPRKTVEAKA